MIEPRAVHPDGIAVEMKTATLQFRQGQGKTRLARQYVPYPFHITRPFYIDPARPDFATLYLQSCSGGLYSGERLRLEIETEADAAAEITTQAATLVRNAKGDHATLETRLNLGADSLAVYSPDPLVLFPDARVKSKLAVTLAPGARALCQEAFALASEAQTQALSGFYKFEFGVTDSHGTPLVLERGTIDLATIGTPASPLGPYRAAAAIYLIGAALDKAALDACTEHAGCRIGASALPNDAGIAIRMLAMDGGSLSAAMQRIRPACFRAIAGFDAAPRRK
jgi:urease accessory protein